MTNVIGMEMPGRAQSGRAMITCPPVGPRQNSWAPGISAGTAARWFHEDRVDTETRIAINTDEDIVTARQTASLAVQKMGFSGSRTMVVTTAISELARNMLLYARAGEIVLSRSDSGAQLTVMARDQGPGIENLPTVLAGGYSTSGGLGLGLCGLRRIVDEFRIDTQAGKGTQVSVSIRG